jgi:membrane protein YdbS with pleckstrin-like domain
MNAPKTTAKKAISRGHLIVSLPVFVLIIGAIQAGKWVIKKEAIPDSLAIVIILLGIALAWLWWCIAVVKWKLWAYKSVENIAELKQKAVKSGLIWPAGHLMEHSEIWRKKDRDKMRELEKKQNQV